RLARLLFLQLYHVFHRRRHQNVALHRQQFVVGNARSTGHADNGARPFLVTNRLIGSIPRVFVTPPRVSLNAMIFAFFSASSRAAVAPALPNPWTATVAPRSGIF